MPRGQPSVIIPPSTPTQRRYEVVKIPLSTKKPPSSTKQSQERDRSHRRPERSRPSRTRTTSHGISPRSSDRYLDLANAQSLDFSRPRIKQYVNDSISGDSPKRPPRNTDPDTVSNQNLPVPGGSLQKSPGHTVEQKAESGSDWKSTAYATTKLAIDLVKETSDAFPPLKAVAAGLSVILNHCDVRSISPKRND